MMTEFEKQVDDYIRSDRQWRRDHRIAHIKWQLARLNTAKAHGIKGLPWDENFWKVVLARNED